MWYGWFGFGFCFGDLALWVCAFVALFCWALFGYLVVLFDLAAVHCLRLDQWFGGVGALGWLGLLWWFVLFDGV